MAPGQLHAVAVAKTTHATIGWARRAFFQRQPIERIAFELPLRDGLAKLAILTPRNQKVALEILIDIDDRRWEQRSILDERGMTIRQGANSRRVQIGLIGEAASGHATPPTLRPNTGVSAFIPEAC